MRALESLLAEARADPNVVGVALFGSRAYGLHLHDGSDWDVLVAVRELGDRWVSERGGEIELAQLTLARVADPPEWFRPALLHVDVLADETGELADALHAATTVDPATAAEPLDGYVNMTYRSLKNARAGLEVATLLDAQEAVPFWLHFVFAVHGRVRPYNAWLEWELRERPLPERVDLALLRRTDPAALRELFRATERLARAHGLDAVLDGWQRDLPFLRGG